MKIGSSENVKSILEFVYLFFAKSIRRTLFFILTSTICFFVFYFHVRHAEYFLYPLGIVYFFYIYRFQQLRLLVYPWMILILLFVVIAGLNFYYSRYFYINNRDFSFSLYEFSIFFPYFIKYLFMVIIYFLSSNASGTFLLKLFKLNDKFTTIERVIFSTILGFSFVQTVLFILGTFGSINLVNFYILATVCIIYNFGNIITYLKLTTNFLRKPKIVEIKLHETFFLLITFVFVASVVASTLRGFQIGSDALRAYFVIPKYIAETHFLPTFSYIKIYPFFNELLFSPAYMLGQIPIVVSTTYFFSFLSLFMFYLCTKEFGVNGVFKNLCIILSPLLYAPYLFLYVVDYKGDMTLTLFSVTLFWLVLIAKRILASNIGFLIGIIVGCCFLIKLTIVFYLIPILVYLLIQTQIQFKTKYTVLFVTKIAAGFLIMILPWFILYKIYIPKYAEVGLGLSNRVNKNVNNYGINLCSSDSYKEVQDQFDIKDSGISKYVEHAKLYLSGGSKINIIRLFDMNDPGALTLYCFSATALVFILYFKAFKLKVARYYFLFITLLISILLGFYTFPAEIWYFAPQTVLFIFLGNVFFYKIIKKSDRLLYLYHIGFVYSLSICYMLLFICVFSFEYFYPLKINPQNVNYVKSYSAYRENHINAYEIGTYLKDLSKDQSNYKVIYSSSISYVSIYFYLDKFYDKYIFYDQVKDYQNEDVLKELIKKENVKYFIMPNSALDQAYECTHNQQKIIKSLFEKYGTVKLNTINYTLYEVSGI